MDGTNETIFHFSLVYFFSCPVEMEVHRHEEKLCKSLFSWSQSPLRWKALLIAEL